MFFLKTVLLRFEDTVNTANRIEFYNKAGKIRPVNHAVARCGLTGIVHLHWFFVIAVL